MSKFEEFLQALIDAQNKEELLGGKNKPESGEEIVAAYVSVAKKLGFDLTDQDVVEGIKAMTQERLAKTEQAAAEMQELSEEDLDRVAGGGEGCAATQDTNCKSTFEDYENCWSNDGCDWMSNGYGVLYKCKRCLNGENSRYLCDDLWF